MQITTYLDGAKYDDETQRIMGLAFGLVCTALRAGDSDDYVKRAIAAKVIDLAEAGERNPDVICELLLKDIRRSWDNGLFVPGSKHRGEGTCRSRPYVRLRSSPPYRSCCRVPAPSPRPFVLAHRKPRPTGASPTMSSSACAKPSCFAFYSRRLMAASNMASMFSPNWSPRSDGAAGLRHLSAGARARLLRVP